MKKVYDILESVIRRKVFTLEVSQETLALLRAACWYVLQYNKSAFSEHEEKMLWGIIRVLDDVCGEVVEVERYE